MKQMKSNIFVALLGMCLIYAGIARASYDLQCAYFKDCKCGEDWTLRMDGGYTYGKFIGMKKSYAEAGVFIAPKHSRKTQNFFDARGYLIENGEGAASAGIGRRLWNTENCRILGANLYYDCRRVKRGFFNRIGVGLEYLGECFDVRVNGYFPLNHGTREGPKHVFNHFIGPFVETCQEKEFAYLGFDGEVGGPIWSDCSLDLYGAIGPYFYHHSERSAIYGGFARINLNVNDWLMLEARISSDTRYHTHAQGRVLLILPLDRLFSCYPIECNPCRDLLTQPVQRNGVIFTESCCSRFFNWDNDP